MVIFISGGVRSGKSSLGEKTAESIAQGRKIYLATAVAVDKEMTDRVKNHRSKRSGKGYITLERPCDIAGCADDLKKDDTVLLDCLGNLLANEMFNEEKQGLNDKAGIKITEDIDKIIDKVEHLIIVSNDVFSDGCSYEDSVVEYIDQLAGLHRKIAKRADAAVECMGGGHVFHKVPTGTNIFDEYIKEVPA